MQINAKVIDLYHGDAVISFDAAYAAGIRGVIHKATQGNTITDKTYAARREQALDAGMLWGAYHYIGPSDMEAQAARFIDLAQPTDATLVAVDHEDRSVPLAKLVAFIEAVKAEIGRYPVVYSGFLIKEQVAKATTLQRAVLAQCELWLSQYGSAPRWPGLWKAPFLWQFTGDGEGPSPHTVDGMGKVVDISSFAGSDTELADQWVAA